MQPWRFSYLLISALLLLHPACASDDRRDPEPRGRFVILTGVVEPRSTVRLTAPFTAVVREAPVERGDRCREGDVLLRLDATLATAEVSKADAMVAAAEAEVARIHAGYPAGSPGLEEARRRVVAAETKRDRLRVLLEAGVGSDEEVAAAERELVASREATDIERAGWERGAGSDLLALDVAEARLRLAEAERIQRRYELDRATLRAPISGVIRSVSAAPGEELTVGVPVIEIVDVFHVRVIADLNTRLQPLVHSGQTAEVTVNTVPPTVVGSEVYKVDPVVDPVTGALRVTVMLPNPDLRFQPGFTAKVSIAVRADSTATPKHADE